MSKYTITILTLLIIGIFSWYRTFWPGLLAGFLIACIVGSLDRNTNNQGSK